MSLHPDAEENYAYGDLHSRQPIDRSSMSDREIVHLFWGQPRYMPLLQQRHPLLTRQEILDRRSSGMREMEQKWFAARTDEDWAEIRAGYEQNGWFGSPVVA